MNDDYIEVRALDQSRIEGLKAWGWVSYLLHLVVAVAAVVPGAQPSIALLVISLIIDLVKRGDAEGSWMANHFSWRIRSVIWAGILYLVTAPLWLLFFVPGWIAWTVISIWFLYRIVRGMVAMNRNQAVDR
ncbi:putative transmembrane protein [Delftia acidovorans SPH-1]|uniref:Putative transmembrane protein n=1 Tax=Delftia acidovorans (strain DSM 14801 / SPH-1) TaxID=398578 RepID=A9BXA4_DELAS|nr:membrane protein [Delftia acidovorans]ABX38180.1 putative transmembrane protein [Delftia acidovorans SPH-1]QPS72623.1 hypothetical protein I6G48_18250 [Delftia acidovorans]